MFFHTERQRLNALEDEKSGHGRHTRTEIPKSLFSCSGDHCRRAEFFSEIKTVKPLIGLTQCWEATRCLPVENAAIHQQSTNNNAVAREELGRGMHHQISTKRHGLAQVGRHEGRIHHERHARRMGNLGNHGDV